MRVGMGVAGVAVSCRAGSRVGRAVVGSRAAGGGSVGCGVGGSVTGTSVLGCGVGGRVTGTSVGDVVGVVVGGCVVGRRVRKRRVGAAVMLLRALSIILCVVFTICCSIAS